MASSAVDLNEESLSDASLIEDEDDEEEIKDLVAPRDEDSRSTTGTDSSVIDLPGEPITAPVESAEESRERPGMEMETVASTEGEEGDDDVDMTYIPVGACGDVADPMTMSPGVVFRGWNDREIANFETLCKTRRIDVEELQDVTLVSSSSVTVISPKSQDFLKGRGRPKKSPSVKITPIESPRLPAKVPKLSKTTATPSSSVSRRESREWRPSGMLFKPLAAGWVREVIFMQEKDGSRKKNVPPTVIYHAPSLPGTKPRVFKTNTELQHFLNSAEPTLSWHNFSFRQEVMGAPPNQEIVRGENEKVDIFPKLVEQTKVDKPSGQTPKIPKATTSPGGLKVKMFSKMVELNSLEALGDTSNKSDIKKDHKENLESSVPIIPVLPASSVSAMPVTTIATLPSPSVKASATSTVTATIGPAVTSMSSIHKAKSNAANPIASRQLPSPPSMTITPISKSETVQTRRASSSATRPPAWTPSRAQRAVLRPSHSNAVSCSIHCPGVNGFPTLSCCSCHSMFHPICVGLMDGVDYGSQYDFYCIDCQPPPGKENSNPFTHFPSFGLSPSTPTGSLGSLGSMAASPGRRRSTDRASANKTSKYAVSGASHPVLPRGLSITPTSRQNVGGLVNGVGKKFPSAPTSAKKRSIESQSVVNIAGVKYLIVPHPSETSKAKADAFDKRRSLFSGRLPILLQPSKDSPKVMPSFEVEETADGKLLLVPTSGPFKKGENPFAVQKKDSVTGNHKNVAEASNSPISKPLGDLFNSNLSVSYFAMLHVFRFLTLNERLRASRVCKLWRDLAYHQSLWNSINLKNIRVASWPNFVDFLNRCRANRLDMRKLHFSKGTEEMWVEVREAFSRLSFVTELLLPRVSCSTMANIVAACPRLESIVASNLSPKEMDIAMLANTRGLKEVKLKVSNGRMKAHGALQSLGSLATSLTKLSLLGLEIISVGDLELIATLSALEHFELGNCSSAPPNLFQAVTALTKLRSLRLEGGVVGMNLGELRWLSGLEKLELIDVNLKEGFGDGLIRLQTLKKLLLIPFYSDEVAAVNTEIVDSAMSMNKLTHFYLGLTNEWLGTMSSLLACGGSKAAGSVQKDSFPILVNGACEMYSLSKLFKTLSNSMPNSRVKILKMSRSSTGKQFIDSLIR